MGCGYGGSKHLRGFNELAESSMIALCEPSPDKVAAQPQAFLPPLVTGDYERFLAAPTDAVVIATPARTHYDLAKRALEHGKHVPKITRLVIIIRRRHFNLLLFTSRLGGGLGLECDNGRLGHEPMFADPFRRQLPRENQPVQPLVIVPTPKRGIDRGYFRRLPPQTPKTRPSLRRGPSPEPGLRGLGSRRPSSPIPPGSRPTARSDARGSPHRGCST